MFIIGYIIFVSCASFMHNLSVSHSAFASGPLRTYLLTYIKVDGRMLSRLCLSISLWFASFFWLCIVSADNDYLGCKFWTLYTAILIPFWLALCVCILIYLSNIIILCCYGSYSFVARKDRLHVNLHTCTSIFLGFRWWFYLWAHSVQTYKMNWWGFLNRRYLNKYLQLELTKLIV